MKRNACVLILAAAAILPAQTVTLNGTARTVSGDPIAGAACRLRTAGNTAVTDAKGHYDFSGSASARAPQGYAVAVEARGGMLALRLDRSARAGLELFSVDGKRLRVLLDGTLPAGLHHFDLGAAGAGRSLLLLRVRIDANSQWHKVTLDGGIAAISGPGAAGALAKEDAADSLYCTHADYNGGMAHINGRRVTALTGTQDFRMFSGDPAWKVCSPPITFTFDSSPGVARYKQLIPDWVATEQEVLMEVCQSVFKLPSQAKKYSDYLADVKTDNGVAATGGNHLFFNSGYIANQPNSYSGWWEVVGVQTHEAVHSYQPYYSTTGADGFGEAMPDAVRALNGFFSWPRGKKCTGAFTDAYQDGGSYWYYIEMKHPGFLTSIWQKKTGDISARVQEITGESLSDLVSQCKTTGMP